jgi:Ala-tRNA(Pro) deacylase
MHIASRVQKLLDEEKVPYRVCEHKLAYTAQEVAAAQHVRGRMVVKSVILRAGDRYVMAVLPASHHVDLDRFGKILGAKEVRLAQEEEFAALFPDSEPGAMAPFGHLYGLSIYADRALEQDDTIFFNDGTHTETIQMAFDDYRRLARPAFAEFADRN